MNALCQHPILACPGDCDIEDLSCHFDPIDADASYLDLVLVKGSERVHLRFHRPVNISIENGFPHATGGMIFYDRSGDGLENIGVEVGDFEALSGAIRFSAKSVTRL